MEQQGLGDPLQEAWMDQFLGSPRPGSKQRCTHLSAFGMQALAAERSQCYRNMLIWQSDPAREQRYRREKRYLDQANHSLHGRPLPTV